MYLRWQEIPFVRLLIPFCLGISLIHYQQSDYYCSLLVISIFLVLLFLSEWLKIWRQNSLFQWGRGVLIFLLLFLIGGQYTYQQIAIQQTDHFGHYLKDVESWEVRISQPLEEKKKSWQAIGEVYRLHKNGNIRHTKGKIVLRWSKKGEMPQISYGDHLLIESNIKAIRPPKPGATFDYQQFMALQQIYHQVYLRKGQWAATGFSSPNVLMNWVYRYRAYATQSLFENMGKKEASVAAALLLGNKQYLDQSIRGIYGRTGAMHVLAVSGMHVAIITGILQWLIQWIPTYRNRLRKHWTQIVLLWIGIWAYALLTGLGASVLRAAIMFTILTAGDLFRKKPNVYNRIAFSAFIILLYDPFLLFHAGFQLSFGAVVGIVLIFPPLNQLYSFPNKILNSIWQGTLVTTAAQIGTLPLVIFYFQQFPLLSFVSNIFLSLFAFLFLLLGVLFFACAYFPFLQACLGKMMELLMAGNNYLLEYLSHYTFAVIPFPTTNMIQCLLGYGMVLSFILYFKFRKVDWLKMGIAMFIITLSIGLSVN